MKLITMKLFWIVWLGLTLGQTNPGAATEVKEPTTTRNPTEAEGGSTGTRAEPGTEAPLMRPEAATSERRPAGAEAGAESATSERRLAGAEAGAEAGTESKETERRPEDTESVREPAASGATPPRSETIEKSSSKVGIRKSLYALSLKEVAIYVGGINKFIRKHGEEYNNTIKNYSNAIEKEKSSSSDYHFQHLEAMEDKIAEYTPNFALHYWNWTEYSEFPSKDPVFSEYLFGKHLNEDNCLDGGAIDYPSNICIKRSQYTPYTFDYRKSMSGLMDSKNVGGFLSKSQTINKNLFNFYSGMDSITKSPQDFIHYALYSFNMKLILKWNDMKSTPRLTPENFPHRKPMYDIDPDAKPDNKANTKPGVKSDVKVSPTNPN